MKTLSFLLLVSLFSFNVYAQDSQTSICIQKDQQNVCKQYYKKLKNIDYLKNTKVEDSYIETSNGRKKINTTISPASSTIIYKYKDQSGKWTYSDQLPENKSILYYIIE